VTAAAAIYKLKSFQNTGIVLMSRVLGMDGTAITQASISSISALIRDMVAGTEEVIALDKTAVVFNTLQKDARWRRDSVGYNFRWGVPAIKLPNATTYRIEITFIPTTGEQFVIAFEDETIDLAGV